MSKTPALIFTALLAAACGGASTRPAGDEAPGPTPAVQRTPMGELPQIDADAVLAHTKVLSSDQYEGRAPGSKGEELSVGYLVDHFKKIGLKPGNPDGTYLQKVPLVGITASPAPLVFKKGSQQVSLKWKDDFVAGTKRVVDSVSLADAELVFVGYGVVAPEFNWDDYKGVDVKGKTLVMLVNDPPVPDPANASELDPKAFGGRAMTYYGRWTYKFEIASEKGAAGIFIIHETVPAGYPFNVVQNSWSGEQFDLVAPDKNLNRVPVQGWVSLDQARNLLEDGRPGFRRAQEAGSVARLAGAAWRHGVNHDQEQAAQHRLAERRREARRKRPEAKDEYAALFSALGPPGSRRSGERDRIYNGAVDNASGVAGVSRLRAHTKLPTPPKRSILFSWSRPKSRGCWARRTTASALCIRLRRRRRDQPGWAERSRADQGSDAHRIRCVRSRRLRARRGWRAGTNHSAGPRA